MAEHTSVAPLARTSKILPIQYSCASIGFPTLHPFGSTRALDVYDDDRHRTELRERTCRPRKSHSCCRLHRRLLEVQDRAEERAIGRTLKGDVLGHYGPFFSGRCIFLAPEGNSGRFSALLVSQSHSTFGHRRRNSREGEGRRRQTKRMS